MSLSEREDKLARMSEEDIDYSDIPPLDEDFFQNAKKLFCMKLDRHIEARIIQKVNQLSQEQVVQVENFIDSLQEKELDTQLKIASTKIAESVFDKVWNNPEDAEYDNL